LPFPTFEKGLCIQLKETQQHIVKRTKIHCECGVELGWYSKTPNGHDRYQTRWNKIQ
jgi:hypothetical protein